MEEIHCEEAMELVESTDPLDRMIVARAKLPDECAEIYLKLSKDKNIRVRQEVAGNKNIPKKYARKIFRKLSKDKNPLVRREVARNENIPKKYARKIFRKLIKDKNPLVRRGVARNRAIPPDCREKIFKRLERDEDQKVLELLQLNPLYKELGNS